MNTTLLPFTDGDWEIFPGCESDAPQVAYPQPETAVVLDGSAVHVFELAESGVIMANSAKYADPTTARMAAERLVEQA